MLKKSFLCLFIFLVSICLHSIGKKDESNLDQKKYQRLQIKKAKPINLSPEETTKAKTDSEDTFSKAFENSSPEVKAALIKAAKEIRQKGSQESKISK
jgi:hypothetical protein